MPLIFITGNVRHNCKGLALKFAGKDYDAAVNYNSFKENALVEAIKNTGRRELAVKADFKGNEIFKIADNGKVQIGNCPNSNHLTSLLSVKGTVVAQKIFVTLDGWCDFVVDKNYNLMSLSDLEKSINQNKHLPGIPTAKEIKEKDLNLGEMQAKLLQKIEELALYVIDLKKENQEIKKENQEIKEQLSQTKK